MPEVLEVVHDVVHELIEVIASLKGLTGKRQAELHAKLAQAAEAAAQAETADVPAGA